MKRPRQLARNVIGCVSGKGGVGKSTTAVNLAIALAGAHNLRVGLLDADIYGPSIPTLMGLSGMPVVAPDTRFMTPLQNHGVRCMSMGFLMPDQESPVVWRGPMASSALQQLAFQTDWGDLDVLMVDFPPGTGDVHLTLTQSVAFSGCIVVSTPQDLALVSAVKGLNMFKKVDVPIYGIVENMAYFECGKCNDRTYIFGQHGARDKAKELGVDYLGEIPIVVNRTGAAAPITVAAPQSSSARPYFHIAEQLAKRFVDAAAQPAGPKFIVD